MTTATAVEPCKRTDRCTRYRKPPDAGQQRHTKQKGGKNRERKKRFHNIARSEDGDGIDHHLTFPMLRSACSGAVAPVVAPVWAGGTGRAS